MPPHRRTPDPAAHLLRQSGQASLSACSLLRGQTQVSEGQQADRFFTTRFYLFFSLTPSQNTFKWFIFIFNGVPFGSKRAFISQNITWSTCSAELWLEEGETQRHSAGAGWLPLQHRECAGGCCQPGECLMLLHSLFCNVVVALSQPEAERPVFPWIPLTCSSSKSKPRREWPDLQSQRTEEGPDTLCHLPPCSVIL